MVDGYHQHWLTSHDAKNNRRHTRGVYRKLLLQEALYETARILGTLSWVNTNKRDSVSYHVDTSTVYVSTKYTLLFQSKTLKQECDEPLSARCMADVTPPTRGRKPYGASWCSWPLWKDSKPSPLSQRGTNYSSSGR